MTFELNNENFNREVDGLIEAMHTFKIPKGTIIVFDDIKNSYEFPEGVSATPAYQWFLKD